MPDLFPSSIVGQHFCSVESRLLALLSLAPPETTRIYKITSDKEGCIQTKKVTKSHTLLPLHHSFTNKFHRYSPDLNKVITRPPSGLRSSGRLKHFCSIFIFDHLTPLGPQDISWQPFDMLSLLEKNIMHTQMSIPELLVAAKNTNVSLG